MSTFCQGTISIKGVKNLNSSVTSFSESLSFNALIPVTSIIYLIIYQIELIKLFPP